VNTLQEGLLGILYALPLALFGGGVIYGMRRMRWVKTRQSAYILWFIGIGLTLLALWIVRSVFNWPPIQGRFASFVSAMWILYGCCVGTLLV
jgi:hypothetical protein